MTTNRKIEKSLLEKAGYEIPENPPTWDELRHDAWRDRGSWYREGEKLYYLEFRCLSSYRGGGTCNCISHSPETWLEVV